MLNVEDFMDHLSNIENQAKLFVIHHSESALDSVFNSRRVLLDSFVEMKSEIAKLNSMIKEGITYEDLYNPDDEINPHCR